LKFSFGADRQILHLLFIFNTLAMGEWMPAGHV